MENRKQVGGSSSSSSGSSFTVDLFGPKDSSSTSTTLFGSVFGPNSTGLGKDSSHSKYMGSAKKQDLGNQYATARHGSADYKAQRSKGESGIASKEKNYHSETTEPCYFSSSIYYGGQEVYSPNSQSNNSHHVFKKDGGDDDANGNNSSGASRGNWWQGSLYY